MYIDNVCFVSGFVIIVYKWIPLYARHTGIDELFVTWLYETSALLYFILYAQW